MTNIPLISSVAVLTLLVVASWADYLDCEEKIPPPSVSGRRHNIDPSDKVIDFLKQSGCRFKRNATDFGHSLNVKPMEWNQDVREGVKKVQETVKDVYLNLDLFEKTIKWSKDMRKRVVTLREEAKTVHEIIEVVLRVNEWNEDVHKGFQDVKAKVQMLRADANDIYEKLELELKVQWNEDVRESIINVYDLLEGTIQASENIRDIMRDGAEILTAETKQAYEDLEFEIEMKVMEWNEDIRTCLKQANELCEETVEFGEDMRDGFIRVKEEAKGVYQNIATEINDRKEKAEQWKDNSLETFEILMQKIKRVYEKLDAMEKTDEWKKNGLEVFQTLKQKAKDVYEILELEANDIKENAEYWKENSLENSQILIQKATDVFAKFDSMNITEDWKDNGIDISQTIKEKFKDVYEILALVGNDIVGKTERSKDNWLEKSQILMQKAKDVYEEFELMKEQQDLEKSRVQRLKEDAKLLYENLKLEVKEMQENPDYWSEKWHEYSQTVLQKAKDMYENLDVLEKTQEWKNSGFEVFQTLQEKAKDVYDILELKMKVAERNDHVRKFVKEVNYIKSNSEYWTDVWLENSEILMLKTKDILEALGENREIAEELKENALGNLQMLKEKSQDIYEILELKLKLVEKIENVNKGLKGVTDIKENAELLKKNWLEYSRTRIQKAKDLYDQLDVMEMAQNWKENGTVVLQKIKEEAKDVYDIFEIEVNEMKENLEYWKEKWHEYSKIVMQNAKDIFDKLNTKTQEWNENSLETFQALQKKAKDVYDILELKLQVAKRNEIAREGSIYLENIKENMDYWKKDWLENSEIVMQKAKDIYEKLDVMATTEVWQKDGMDIFLKLKENAKDVYDNLELEVVDMKDNVGYWKKNWLKSSHILMKKIKDIYEKLGVMEKTQEWKENKGFKTLQKKAKNVYEIVKLKLKAVEENEIVRQSFKAVSDIKEAMEYRKNNWLKNAESHMQKAKDVYEKLAVMEKTEEWKKKAHQDLEMLKEKAEDVSDKLEILLKFVERNANVRNGLEEFNVIKLNAEYWKNNWIEYSQALMQKAMDIYEKLGVVETTRELKMYGLEVFQKLQEKTEDVYQKFELILNKVERSPHVRKAFKEFNDIKVDADFWSNNWLENAKIIMQEAKDIYDNLDLMKNPQDWEEKGIDGLQRLEEKYKDVYDKVELMLKVLEKDENVRKGLKEVNTIKEDVQYWKKYWLENSQILLQNAKDVYENLNVMQHNGRDGYQNAKENAKNVYQKLGLMVDVIEKNENIPAGLKEANEMKENAEYWLEKTQDIMQKAKDVYEKLGIIEKAQEWKTDAVEDFQKLKEDAKFVYEKVEYMLHANSKVRKGVNDVIEEADNWKKVWLENAQILIQKANDVYEVLNSMAQIPKMNSLAIFQRLMETTRDVDEMLNMMHLKAAVVEKAKDAIIAAPDNFKILTKTALEKFSVQEKGEEWLFDMHLKVKALAEWATDVYQNLESIEKEWNADVRDGVKKVKAEAMLAYEILGLKEESTKLNADVRDGFNEVKKNVEHIYEKLDLEEKTLKWDKDLREDFQKLSQQAKELYEKLDLELKLKQWKEDIREGVIRIKQKANDIREWKLNFKPDWKPKVHVSFKKLKVEANDVKTKTKETGDELHEGLQKIRKTAKNVKAKTIEFKDHVNEGYKNIKAISTAVRAQFRDIRHQLLFDSAESNDARNARPIRPIRLGYSLECQEGYLLDYMGNCQKVENSH